MKKQFIITTFLVCYCIIAVAQWQILSGFPNTENAMKILVINDTMIVASNSMSGAGIYVSPDRGNTWSAKNTSLGFLAFPFVKDGSNLFAGSWGNGVLFSSDKGQSWLPRNNGLPSGQLNVLDLIVDNNDIYVCMNSGIYYSSNKAATWQSISFPGTVSATTIVKTGNTILSYISTQSLWSVYKSYNNGSNWSELNFPASFTMIDKFVECNHTLLAANGVNPNTECLYVSADTGNTWIAANGLYEHGLNIVYDFIAYNTDIYLASLKGVYKSSDNGLNWINTGCPWPVSLAIIGDTIYAGNGNQGIWKRSLSNMPSAIAEEDGLSSNSILYPNPASDKINIKYKQNTSEKNIGIAIYNIMGQLISSHKLQKDNSDIDISNLEKGIYFIQISGDNPITAKFLKK